MQRGCRGIEDESHLPSQSPGESLLRCVTIIASKHRSRQADDAIWRPTLFWVNVMSRSVTNAPDVHRMGVPALVANPRSWPVAGGGDGDLR